MGKHALARPLSRGHRGFICCVSGQDICGLPGHSLFIACKGVAAKRLPLWSQCLGDVLGDHRCLVCKLISFRIPGYPFARTCFSWHVVRNGTGVFGHSLYYMALFGIPTSGFCIFFRYRNLIFSTPGPILGPQDQDLGSG